MTAEGILASIEQASKVRHAISYVRALIRGWGFTRKVPVGRHVRRANRWKIGWFRRKIRPRIEEMRHEGYTIGVQDESIFIADARPRKGVYTPKGVRAAYTYTGSHSKTVVFGMITTDGRGLFKQYDKFTKEEFVDFLKAAHEEFGKILMILDGAPAEQGSGRQEGAKGDERRGRAGVPSAGVSGSERDRGDLAPDEARRTGYRIRQTQQDVQGHRRLDKIVHAETGCGKIPLQGAVGLGPAHRTWIRTGDRAHINSTLPDGCSLTPLRIRMCGVFP